MPGHNLFNVCLPVRLKVDGTNWEVAAGTGDTLTSSSIDLGQFPATSIAVLLTFGAITATATGVIKLQSSPDNSIWTDITGATQSYTAANSTEKNRAIEVYKPAARYIRAVTTRVTANVVISALNVFPYHALNQPPAKDATLAAAATIVNNP